MSYLLIFNFWLEDAALHASEKIVSAGMVGNIVFIFLKLSAHLSLDNVDSRKHIYGRILRCQE